MELTDQVLVPLLLNRNEGAFETVFKRYFKDLHAYACSILKAEVYAEEMVQQVFFKLWDRNQQLQVQGSLAAYLYRSVHNECLNHLKHLKVRHVHQAYATHHAVHHAEDADPVRLEELEKRIDIAMNRLPEQCRTIFQLSRFEELRYREIADKLGISVKTVENQMGKALRIMREELAEYLPSLIILYLLNA